MQWGFSQTARKMLYKLYVFYVSPNIIIHSTNGITLTGSPNSELALKTYWTSLGIWWCPQQYRGRQILNKPLVKAGSLCASPSAGAPISKAVVLTQESASESLGGRPNPDFGAPPPAFDSVDPEQAWESAFLTSSLVMPKLLVPGTLRTPGCKWRGKTGQMSSQGFACGWKQRSKYKSLVLSSRASKH